MAAYNYLRDQFDAVDANDLATHVARLQQRMIDPRADISENDLRLQYDHMMIACAGIRRCGAEPMTQGALIAMFDNSLNVNYSQIRQLVRRERHATLTAHFSDYLGQVRAEVASRGPQPRAFAASSPSLRERAWVAGRPLPGPPAWVLCK